MLVALTRAPDTVGPTLPVAFAARLRVRPASSGATSRRGFAYTRLAATVSAAMRLMAIGQTDAHALLARVLDRVPATRRRRRSSRRRDAADRVVRAGAGRRSR